MEEEQEVVWGRHAVVGAWKASVRAAGAHEGRWTSRCWHRIVGEIAGGGWIGPAWGRRGQLVYRPAGWSSGRAGAWRTARGDVLPG